MKGSSLLRIKPIARALVLALIACGLIGADLLWPGQLRSVPDQLNLPADLAKYKEWRALLQSPAPVPLELWIRCMAPTPTDWTQAREKYGPHTEHYIQVYANQIATQTLRKGKATRFLTGAMIAKEKLTDSPQGTVAGVAFMIKRGTSQFASTGGWEFAYYPRAGDSASLKACATCHRSAASKGYVFGRYPSSGDPLAPTQTRSR
jgi:mono/diheme cytochrome c family protein